MNGSEERHTPVPTIVFCHDDAVPLFSGERAERFGGAETQIYELAVELSKRDDVQVRFIVDSPEIELPSYPNITFVRYPEHIKHALPGLGRIINRRRTKQVIPRPETSVWIHTIATPATWTNYLRARNLGMKFVIRMSSDADVDGSLIPASMREQYRNVINHADAVVTQSQEQTEMLSELYPDATAEPIPKGISYLPPVSTEPAQRNGFTWVGRCVALKRPWLFIECARRFPDISFTMILGTDDIDLERHLTEDIEHIANLSLLHDCGIEDVHRTLESSRGLIHTSALEGGAPVVFYEAFRAECPVYSLTVNPDGLFDKYPVGRCFNSDFERLLRDVIDTQADELAAVDHYGIRDYFENHCSITSTADKYVQMVYKLVGLKFFSSSRFSG